MPSLQTNACAYIPSFGLRKPKSSASSPILAPAPSLSPPSGPPSVRKNLSMAASEYVPSFGPTSAPTHPAFAPRPAETEPQLSGNMKVGGDILLLPMSDFQFVFATLSWNVDLLRILLSRAQSPLLPQMTETAAIGKSEDAGQAPTTIQKERASSPLAANLVAQATTPTSNNSRCATSTVTWSQRLGRSQANGNTMTVKDTTCGADGCTTVGSASFNTTQCGAENVNPSSRAFAENYGTAAFPSLSEVLHMQPKRRGNVFHECSTRTCAATKEPGASFPNPSPVVSRAVTPQSFRSVVSPLTVPEGSSAVTLLPPCDGQPMTYAAVLRRALAAPQPASNAASLLTLQRIAAHPSVMSATASANTNASVRKGAVASVKTPMSTVQYHRRSRRHPHGVRSPSLSLTNDLPELRDVTAEDEGEEPPLLASSAASSYRLASTPSAFLMAVDAFPHSPTTAISSFPTSPVTGTDIGRPWSSVTPSSYGFGMQIGFPTGETVQALDNRLEASGRWSIPSPHTNGSESRRGSIQSALLAVPSSKQSRRRRARRRLHGRGPSFTIMVPSVTESPRAEYLFTAPNVDSEAALRLLSYVPAFPMQGHFPKDAHGGTNRSSTHPAQHRLLSQVYFQPWKLGSLLNRGDDADVVHWGSAYASKHPPLLGDADAEDDVVESVDALEDEETAHMVRRTQRGVAKLRNTDARARKERRRPQHGTGSVEPALGLPLSALWSKPDEAALKRLRDSRRQQKYGTEEGNESIMDGWVDGAWRSTTPSVSAGREGSFEIPAGAPTPEVVEFVSHSDESMSFFLQKFFRAALIVVIAQVDMNHGRVTQRSRDENGTALSASESAALGFVRQHMTAFRSMVNQFVMRTGTEVERRSAQPIFAESVSNGGSSPTPSLFSHPRLHQMLNAANVNEARGFYHASYGGSLPTGGPVGGPGELHPLWTDQLYLSGKDAAWQPLLMELLGVERVLQCYAENPSDSEAAGSTVDEGKLSGADRPMTANTGVMQLSSSSVPIHHTLLQALQKFLETTIAKEDAFLYHAERAERHGGVATGDLMALHQVMDHESTENAMFADYLAPHLRPPLPAGVGSTLKNPDPSHPHNDIATCCRGMLTPLEWKPYATYSDPVFGQATTHRRSPDTTHVYAAILPLTGKMIIKWAIPSEDTSSYNLSVFFQPIIFNFLQGAPLPLFLDSKHANGPHQPLNPARSRMAAEPFRLTPAQCQEPQLPNMAAQPRRGSVLVHCSAGMHRSCGMVIAFLLWLESQCRGLPQYPFGNSDGVFSRPSLAAIIEGQFLHYQKSVFELAVAHVHQQRSMAEPIATVHYLLKEYSSHLLLP